MDPFDLRLWPGFAEAGGNLSSPAVIEQITIDSRRIGSPLSLFVPLEGSIHDGHKFISQAAQAGARYALAKKGWASPESLDSLTLLRVENPLQAFQQIAKAYRHYIGCPVIAIAGSFGKTMVKDLLLAMLSTTYPAIASPESFNSQIGVPLSLLTIQKNHKLALIETGISQRGEMDALADMVGAEYAIVTHIGKKHIATLGSLEAIAGEILKIASLPPAKKWTILPKDPCTRGSLHQITGQFHFWNEHSSSLPHARFTSEETSAKMLYRIDFPGKDSFEGEITSGFYYFLDLINMTVKAAWLLGVSQEAICSVLQKYQPEPTRTEIWKSPIGTTFINDTYCSDPQSVDQSLKHLQKTSNAKGKKIFVFGGMRTNHQHLDVDYGRIGKAIHRAQVDGLMLFGQHNFDPLIREATTLNPSITIVHRHSYKETLNLLRENIQQDDTVLIKGDRKQPIDVLIETFDDSICSNQCIINLAAIGENLKAIRTKLPKATRMMMIVKALAYGTDAIRMAKFLETCGVDILGVSYVDEGVALRRAGVTQSIFVINAAVYESAKVVKWNLEVGVSDRLLIEALAAEAGSNGKKIPVHLHVDTGMSRFGCRPEEALELALLIKSLPSLDLVGIMTHFACADDHLHDAFTLEQAKRFEEVIDTLASRKIHPQWRHAANTSAAVRFYFPRFNMVRIGLGAYGLNTSQSTKQALELRPALSLVSRIVGINKCKKGETISYGRSYSIQHDEQRIAVLPIGYFDGLHRNYSGKGQVIIRGQKAPMVGKICMDFLMVDVTKIPNAAPGDSVLIFGEDEYGHYLPPEELPILQGEGNAHIHLLRR
jgi:Alr-MurF fusion protein